MVTIIVLLILAGISLAMLTGSNGLLGKATKAGEDSTIGEEKERVAMAYNGALTEKYKTDINATVTANDMKAEFVRNGMTREDVDVKQGSNESNEDITVKFEKTKHVYVVKISGKIIYSGISNEEEGAYSYRVPIPQGFYPINAGDATWEPDEMWDDAYEKEDTEWVHPTSEDALKAGMVITDETGNEFVWIPVPIAVEEDSENPEESANYSKAMAAKIGTNYRGILYKFAEEDDFVPESYLTTYKYNITKLGIGKEAGNLNLIRLEYMGFPRVRTGCVTTTSEYREPDTVSDFDNNYEDYLSIIEEILPTQEGEESKYADMNTFKATMQEDYNEMIESVKTYGGFYVGRYETSLSIDEKVQSKYNQIPVSAGFEFSVQVQDEEEDEPVMEWECYRWYGLYAKQKEFSTSSVQGSMIWGSQYDAMLNFAMITPDAEKVSSIEYGNYSGSIEKTGTYFQIINGNQVFDKICNIYDLGGNMWEWTLEAEHTGDRVLRGSTSYSEVVCSPSYRFGYDSYHSSEIYGSRLSLYIK